MASKQDSVQALTLEQARFAALAKGWPALYVALCAVLTAVAFVHMTLTPVWAWGMFPLFLIPKAVLWLLMWRGRRDPVPSTAYCVRAVRILGIEVVLCVGAFVTWEVWLTRWGNSESMLLLALCMGGQMVFILFGLLHLRIASVMAAGFCLIGMLMIAFRADGASGSASYTFGIAILLIGGLSGLAYIAYSTYDDFSSLVVSRLALVRKNEQIEALGEETLRIANTDMLTEIGNRRSCFHQLERALAGSRQTGRPVSFGVIDLDGFKGVNDTHGHLVGDRLLTAIAERLKRNLEGHGQVFRLGGDEFAFIVPHEDRPERLLEIGDEIIASVSQPIEVGGLRLMLGCSIGFASFPRTASDETELYDRADHVLYQAKRAGRARTVVFGEEHRAEVEASGRIEAALRSADLDAEFFLEFQPVVDPADGRTVLMEALPRWRSPAFGLVAPERFLPVAEQSGIVSALTPVLLRKALEAAKGWPEGARVAVHVSKLDILTPDKILALVSILGRSSLSPGRVAFAIPEAALAKHADRAAVGFQALQAAGATIILNDAGIGRTNFAKLPGLGVDMIKVASDDAGTTILRLAAALSREMVLGCIVGGLDTGERLEAARPIGGILMQGLSCAPPMGEAEAREYLRREAAEPRQMTA